MLEKGCGRVELNVLSRFVKGRLRRESDGKERKRGIIW